MLHMLLLLLLLLSNFLIYEMEAAVEADPAIFGRYLVTLWRQLLAAADAFRAED